MIMMVETFICYLQQSLDTRIIYSLNAEERVSHNYNMKEVCNEYISLMV
jgi:hypothetical protein